MISVKKQEGIGCVISFLIEEILMFNMEFQVVFNESRRIFT